MKLEFQYNKVRGRIVEKYGNVTNFAKSIKANKSTISSKLLNKRGMTSKDIVIFSNALGISKEEIGDYFFS